MTTQPELDDANSLRFPRARPPPVLPDQAAQPWEAVDWDNTSTFDTAAILQAGGWSHERTVKCYIHWLGAREGGMAKLFAEGQGSARRHLADQAQ